MTTDARPRHRFLRSLGLLAAVAVEMLFADYAASFIVAVAAFGGVPGLLFGVLVVATVLVVMIAVTARVVIGRPTVFGAICVTLLLAGLGVYGLFEGLLLPMPFGGSVPLHLAVCGLCALAFGLFTGPWPLRLVGPAAGAGVIVLLLALPGHPNLPGDRTIVVGRGETPSTPVLPYTTGDGHESVVQG